MSKYTLRWGDATTTSLQWHYNSNCIWDFFAFNRFYLDLMTLSWSHSLQSNHCQFPMVTLPRLYPPNHCFKLGLLILRTGSKQEPHVLFIILVASVSRGSLWTRRLGLRCSCGFEPRSVGLNGSKIKLGTNNGLAKVTKIHILKYVLACYGCEGKYIHFHLSTWDSNPELKLIGKGWFNLLCKSPLTKQNTFYHFYIFITESAFNKQNFSQTWYFLFTFFAAKICRWLVAVTSTTSSSSSSSSSHRYITYIPWQPHNYIFYPPTTTPFSSKSHIIKSLLEGTTHKRQPHLFRIARIIIGHLRDSLRYKVYLILKWAKSMFWCWASNPGLFKCSSLRLLFYSVLCTTDA